MLACSTVIAHFVELEAFLVNGKAYVTWHVLLFGPRLDIQANVYKNSLFRLWALVLDSD